MRVEFHDTTCIILSLPNRDRSREYRYTHLGVNSQIRFAGRSMIEDRSKTRLSVVRK